MDSPQTEQPELIVREPMPGRKVPGHGRPKNPGMNGRPPGKLLRISTRQLAIALITANGDRTLVAKQLGLKRTTVTQRINANPQLRARFAMKSHLQRKKLDMGELSREAKMATAVDEVGIMTRTMEEMAVGQASIGNIALGRLTQIQERLKLGREARIMSAIPAEDLTPEQKRFIKENELDYDSNGTPVEEKLLMEQEVALIREYTRINETISQISYKKVVTEQLMRKLGGVAGRNRPKPTLASAPKTITQVTNISGSQVVVQSPNGN